MRVTCSSSELGIYLSLFLEIGKKNQPVHTCVTSVLTTKLFLQFCWSSTQTFFMQYGEIWRSGWSEMNTSHCWKGGILYQEVELGNASTMPDDMSAIFKSCRLFPNGPGGESGWLCLRENSFCLACAESQNTNIQNSIMLHIKQDISHAFEYVSHWNITLSRRRKTLLEGNLVTLEIPMAALPPTQWTSFVKRSGLKHNLVSYLNGHQNCTAPYDLHKHIFHCITSPNLAHASLFGAKLQNNQTTQNYQNEKSHCSFMNDISFATPVKWCPLCPVLFSCPVFNLSLYIIQSVYP